MKPFTKLQSYLADCIDLTGQDLGDNLNDPDKARALFVCYWDEKGQWYESQAGRIKAVEDWLQGLPSSLDIVYSNNDILSLWGDTFPHIPQYTDLQQERIVDQYWATLARSLVDLWYNVGVTDK